MHKRNYVCKFLCMFVYVHTVHVSMYLCVCTYTRKRFFSWVYIWTFSRRPVIVLPTPIHHKNLHSQCLRWVQSISQWGRLLSFRKNAYTNCRLSGPISSSRRAFNSGCTGARIPGYSAISQLKNKIEICFSCNEPMSHKIWNVIINNICYFNIGWRMYYVKYDTSR